MVKLMLNYKTKMIMRRDVPILISNQLCPHACISGGLTILYEYECISCIVTQLIVNSHLLDIYSCCKWKCLWN